MEALHRFHSAFAAFIVSSYFVGVHPVFAANGPLQDEISASQRGEYTQTINIGQKLVESYPNNDLAHYYLADAYYHTNQLRQAEEEYRQCLRVTQNKTLQTYCQDFLSRVQNISLQSIAAPNSVPVKMDEVSKLHEQMHQDEARRTSEETAIIIRLRRDAEMKIKSIQDQLQADLANIPDTGTEPVLNPDIPRNRNYERYMSKNRYDASRLNNEAERATTAIKTQLEWDIARLKAGYAQHETAVEAFSHGINSQLKPGVSDIQLTPHNLGLNVKNYENFAPSSTTGVAAPPVVEMKATPGVLRSQ